MASGAPAKRPRTGLAALPVPSSGSSPLHPDWANLTSGPAALIAERALANDVADYVRFRAACAPWRACCADPREHGVGDRRFHPRRWILLPPRSSSARGRRRRFLNVGTGEPIRVLVPDLRSYHFLARTAEGLLVLCRKRTNAIELLNPLTGQRADYPAAEPSLLPFPHWVNARSLYRYPDHWARTAVLADDSTLAFLRNQRTVAVARPGDGEWTRLTVHVPKEFIIMSSLTFRGRLYCVTGKKILAVEWPANHPPRLAVVADHGQVGLAAGKIYPVYGDDGGLILVHRRKNPPPAGGSKFAENLRAYRAILDTGSLVRVRELGGRALFVGGSVVLPFAPQSVAVSTTVSAAVKADTVYVAHRDTENNASRLKAVAFDLRGASYEPSFGKKDIAQCLVSCVCSDLLGK